MSVTSTLPTIDAHPPGRPPSRDLARGWNVLLFWGGPIAWIILSSVASAALHLSSEQFGVLLIVGTLWFGGICLFNALSCGRAHCWVDGILLPGLAVFGGVNLVENLQVPWASYLSALWGILLLSVIVECVVGSYPRRRRSGPNRRPAPSLVPPPEERGRIKQKGS